LFLGLLAAIGEGVANLLEPWPLKIVLDNVLRSHSSADRGWLNRLIFEIAGSGRLSTLRFAVAAVLGIAILGALCSYAE